MPTPMIAVEGVWKKFRTGEQHNSLRDLIPAAVKRLIRGRPDPAVLESNAFWAVKDLSFEVPPGKALGVIGHNGAGKSTLLKLLTRILRPTRGRVKVTGRIGALIEIAAGFHPDLTGRENVYLQGAIMGMRTAETRQRFDEIVEFAGVEQFIDTPVKRYSSGMNARLGFAIAAHLEPDILIIDEVLSVGDMAFQTRAFARMREVVRSGIPVVVVSHQLDRITELCTEAILLRRGELVVAGTPAECVKAYVAGEVRGAGVAECQVGSLLLKPIELPNDGRVESGHRIPVRLNGTLSPNARVRRYGFGVRLRRMESGLIVYESYSHHAGVVVEQPGPFSFVADLQLNVPMGLYSIEISVEDADRDQWVGDGPAIHLEVRGGELFTGSVQLNAVMTVS